MNSLEFIENIIKNLKEILKGIDKQIQDNQNYPTLLTHHIGEKEHFEKELAHFYQIKSELEAWEIAKAKEIDILAIKTALDLESFNIDLVKAYQLTDYEFKTLKKALEVQNE